MREEITAFNSSHEMDVPFFIQMTGISYCDSTYRIERKNSDIYVFEYIIKGEGTVIINGQSFSPVEGDIYILHRGSNHVYFSDPENPWTKIWFNASGSLIDSLMQVYGLNSTFHVPGLNLEALFFKFLETAKSGGETVSEIFDRASLICHEIIMNIAKAVAPKKPNLSREALLLREYLDKHVDKKVGISDLSRLICRSPSQTIRIFRKEFGITPYDYLLKKRIDMAKLLLLNTNMQVKEIAYKLCFADEHYFSNFFREKAGCSPLEYKRAGGKQKSS